MAAKNFAGLAKKVFDVTIDPTSVTNGTVSLQTFAVPGLTLDMFPVVQVDSWEFADVRIVSARVSAANTLELAFQNFGVGARNLAAFPIKVMGL